MKKFGLMAAALAACVSFTSCSQDEEVSSVPEFVPMQLNSVGLQQAETRAGITAGTLPGGTKIGVFAFNKGGQVDYDNNGAFKNVEYNQGSTWTAQTPPGIVFSSTLADVYAYYPYTSKGGTYSAVPIIVKEDQGTGCSAGTADDTQTDYMWATKVGDRSNAVPAVALSMNHALAMLSFKFVKGKANPYPGKGTVTKIEFMDASAGSLVKAGEGTMNIVNGIVTCNGLKKTIFCAPNKILLDKSGATDIPKMLIYPIGTVAKSTLAFKFTIDGKVYKLPIEEVVGGYVAGKNYEYEITLSGVKPEIKVTVKPWTKESIKGDISTPVA